MAKKITGIIYELPARFPVEINGEIVDYGRTAYQAAEMAKQHGATELEVIKCRGQQVSISLASLSSRRSTPKQKARTTSSGKSSAQSSQPSGPSQSSEPSSTTTENESPETD